jgi:dihydroorotase-like cyclic amidohydrolase
MLNRPWQESWERFSEQPARHLGLPAGLQIGHRADFCWLRLDASQHCQELRVFAGGCEVSAVPLETLFD